MKSPSSRLLLASLAALMLSCGDDPEDPGNNPDPNTPNNPNNPGGDTTTYVPAPKGAARPQAVPAAAVDCGAGSGTLTGSFLAPNGTTPVAGAFVYFASGDCWAGTDKAGKFAVKGLPSGATVVRMEKGLFRSQGNATPGGTVALRVEASQVKLAYVPGMYDSIEKVLERLGFTAVAIEAEQLSTTDLTTYSGLFLNCGLDETYVYDDTTLEVLRSYVRDGGVLYASDWAESYVQALFPGKVGFVPDNARVGKVSEQQALVLDEGFKRGLGKAQAVIQFDQEGWAVIDSVPSGTTVLVSGPAPTSAGTTLEARPYMVQFPEGQGRVSYTSFHNESQLNADMNILLEQLLLQL